MKRHLAKTFGTDIYAVHVVCLFNCIIYDDYKRLDEIPQPIQVMIGNHDRVIPPPFVTSLPDMIVSDEMDPRAKMSCGHAISKTENENIYSKY